MSKPRRSCEKSGENQEMRVYDLYEKKLGERVVKRAGMKIKCYAKAIENQCFKLTPKMTAPGARIGRHISKKTKWGNHAQPLGNLLVLPGELQKGLWPCPAPPWDSPGGTPSRSLDFVFDNTFRQNGKMMPCYRAPSWLPEEPQKSLWPCPGPHWDPSGGTPRRSLELFLGTLGR